jgi:hypothetical protein
LVNEALAGYARYQELSGQFAQLVIDDTRQQLKDISNGIKKKTRHRTFSLPKTRKSSS